MSNWKGKIHSTAVIDMSAKIAPGVLIGPYSIIGPQVEIDEGTWIGPHVVISKLTKIGKHNKFFQFCSIGEDPQDLHYEGEPSRLIIGDHNTFREGVTINRGTAKQNMLTSIGDHNLFMACSHVAHDCTVGNHTVFANSAALAGHIVVNDFATVGAFSGIHQFCNIGAYSFITRGAMVVKDVLPYIMVAGNDAQVFGLNSVGLKRNGFSPEAISNLEKAYKLIFRSKMALAEVLNELMGMLPDCPEVQLLIDGIKRAERGVLR
ncbi:MAG: acyl-ACP--UDP-N-acetylglucosamine O-acyltransferase [Gammaproteobacteria bacterium]|nr:acyl-ACP--UDP-N-acetylglucosamine O-acyltransferase [Gammaproteobacteria bacterium]